MPLDSTLPQYTYINVSFNRIVDGDNYVLWFTDAAIANTEPILDSPNYYTDVGGSQVQTLTLVGSFADATQRDLMLTKVKTTGTLSNGRGRSRTVLLESAVATFRFPGLTTAELVFRTA